MNASTLERPAGTSPPRSALLLGAVGAFLVANLIHNGGGLDPAAVVVALLANVYWWRARRALLFATVLVIALPAFAFLDWTALADFSNLRRFFNHLALFFAGVLAILGAAWSVLAARRTT